MTVNDGLCLGAVLIVSGDKAWAASFEKLLRESFFHAELAASAAEAVAACQ